jgi:predicted XRE-type DNA-binding protein
MSHNTVGQTVIRKLKKSGLSKRTQRMHLRKAAAKAVITALRQYGMTQTGIANYLGVTQAAISNNLNGVTTPSVASLKLLAELAQSFQIELPEMSQWREL